MRTRRTFHRDQTESRRRATPARKERRDMLSVIADEQARAELALDLDELLREGARRMLAVALEAEIDPDTGARQQFQSVILPRWCRRSPKVAEVLPLLYLHGLSSSDFVPALTELLGSAAGLSAAVITRLTTQWQAEREA